MGRSPLPPPRNRKRKTRQHRDEGAAEGIGTKDAQRGRNLACVQGDRMKKSWAAPYQCQTEHVPDTQFEPAATART